MENKTSSFRTTDHNKDFLNDLHGSVSAGASRAIDAYINLRPIILKAVGAKFTPDNIRTIAQVLKKGAYDPTFMASKQILVSKLDMESDQIKDKKQQSDLAVIIETVKTLSPVECYFLQEEIFRRIEK